MHAPMIGGIDRKALISYTYAACMEVWLTGLHSIGVRIGTSLITHYILARLTLFRNCAPGGYIEQVELSVDPTSDDGSVTYDNIFAEWGRVSLEMGERFGKTFRIHERMKGYIEQAGFEDVVEVVYKMPIGPWSKDPHMKQVGLWNLLDWQEGCEGWCVAHLTRAMGVSYSSGT